MTKDKLDGLEDLRMLNSSELSEIIGIKSATLRSWRKRGFGPNFIKADGLKGQVRYMVKDVRTWIESKRIILDEISE